MTWVSFAWSPSALAAQGHVAVEHRVFLGAGQRVTFDVGGLLGVGDAHAFGCGLCLRKRLDHVLHRAQAPIQRHVVAGLGVQREGDAQGQRKQAQGWAHGESRWRKTGG